MIKKNFLSYIRFLLYGLTLLFLFHFETTSIGSVGVPHLWKGAVLAYLIFVIFREKKLKMFIYGQGSKFHICGEHDTVPRPQPAS